MFTEKGFETKTLEETREEMIEEAKVRFAPYLGGEQLRTDDSSVLGRVFSTTALPIYQTREYIPLILQGLDLNQAEFIQLDNLAKSVYNMTRLDSSQATGLVILEGKYQTSVSKYLRVSNIRTGDLFSTDSVVEFQPNKCSGVTIEILGIEGEYTLTYSINGYLSDSADISFKIGSSDTTIEDVANRFVDAVNTQSSYLTSIKNKDNTVLVKLKDDNQVGSFSLSGKATFKTVFVGVQVTSMTYNSVEAEPNIITVVNGGVNSVISVYNPFTIDASLGVESDEDFRDRIRLKSVSSNRTSNAIGFKLKSLSGVNYVNTRSSKDGIYITVDGGNTDEVAVAIADVVADGIDLLGNITRNVRDFNGGSKVVRFSRITKVPIKIEMSLIVYPTFPANGIVRIKQAIVEWFNNLEVSEDIYFSRLYEPINKIGGFSVKGLKYSKKSGVLGTNDVIVINHNEMATITPADIRIGGQ